MRVSEFAICHLAPNIFPNAQMFQAQQASTIGFNQSTKPRAMSPGNQALQSTRQYIMYKIILKVTNFYGVYKQAAPWRRIRSSRGLSGFQAAYLVTRRHTRSLGRSQCQQVTKHRVMCIVI